LWWKIEATFLIRKKERKKERSVSFFWGGGEGIFAILQYF
jgi:hypothetical protein